MSESDEHESCNLVNSDYSVCYKIMSRIVLHEQVEKVIRRRKSSYRQKRVLSKNCSYGQKRVKLEGRRSK